MAIVPYGSSTLTCTYSAVLSTTWTSVSDSYYTQRVTVEGILASDNPIIDLITTTSGYEDEQDSWEKIFKAETSDNAITFYSRKITTVDITLQIKVVR